VLGKDFGDSSLATKFFKSEIARAGRTIEQGGKTARSVKTVAKRAKFVPPIGQANMATYRFCGPAG
jgi:hypothetical protein